MRADDFFLLSASVPAHDAAAVGVMICLVAVPVMLGY
jgi:hypothetical protein